MLPIVRDEDFLDGSLPVHALHELIHDLTFARRARESDDLYIVHGRGEQLRGRFAASKESFLGSKGIALQACCSLIFLGLEEAYEVIR